MARLRAAPVHAGSGVGRLVGDEELDRLAEHGVGELAGSGQPLEALAEVAAEEVVDGLQHLGPGAVVLDEGQAAARLLPPLSEHRDVRVAEPVDRLELVTDEEDVPVAGPVGEQVHELALEAIRVLELVDHDRLEAQCLLVAKLRVVPEQIAGDELEILEVERRLAPLGGRVGLREAVEELLEEIPVAHRELVERRLLQRDPRLLVRRAPLAARPVGGEVEEIVGPGLAGHGVDQRCGARALEVGRRPVVHEAASGLAQGLQPLGHRRTLAELEDERPARRAQRVVDPRDHPAEPARLVRRQQPRTFLVVRCAEGVERLVEGLAREDGRLRAVELAKARVEAGLERIGLEQPVAEAVNRRDPRAVEAAREIGAPTPPQLCTDPGPQLACRPLRVGDDEDRLDVQPPVAHRLDEALDEHRGLPGPRAGGDEHAAPGVDGGLLLGIRRPGHARLTRHIVQRVHQAGHSPPLGSWWTSPPRIRPAKPRAVSRAPSTCAQNASSSR